MQALIPGCLNGNPVPLRDAPRGAGTGGSETSQYPQEKKPIGIPGVTASETGGGQTEPSNEKLEGMWSCRTWVLPNPSTRSPVEVRHLRG